MSNQNEERLTTISIKTSTREKLKVLIEKKGETYDDIILRLIEKAYGKP
jgi:hypothetical protein